MQHHEPAYHLFDTKNGVEACFNDSRSGELYGARPMTSFLPIFMIQLTFVLFVNRIFLIIFKPLSLPPIVAKILCGVLLGPTGIGQAIFYKTKLFSLRAILIVETFANLALVYYMFLLGLEIEFTPILKCGRKTINIALLGVIFPFCIGLGLFFVLFNPVEDDLRGSIFWAVALTATNVPDVIAILINLKFLHIDIGKLALSISVISDLCTWLLLIISLSFLNARSYSALLSTIGVILICVFVIHPTISWIIIRFPSIEENYNETQIWFILGWVLLFGLITDAFGSHAIVGSFMLGVIMPRGEIIRFKLMDRLDDFVSEIMMPMFFFVSGARCDINSMLRNTPWYMVILVVGFSFVAKIASSLIMSLSSDMPIQEAITLGVLMNTKGVLALIVINIGRDIKALDNHAFSIMVLAFLIMTCSVQPIVAAIYKNRRSFVRYKYRTIQSSTKIPNMQFRVLVCVHSMREVSSIISLLEASNATKESHMSVIAFHVVELIGRSTTMLVMHDQAQAQINDDYETIGTRKSKLDQIMDAFKLYEKRCNGVFVQTITTVSPNGTMHKDICSLAEDKHVALIIIPFQTEVIIADEKIEDIISPFVGISQQLLKNTPCSVGLLIDRGLDSLTSMQMQSGTNSHGFRIAMLFFGGPDDRDALAYAWRMAGRAFVSLTMIRFLVGREALSKLTTNPEEDSIHHGNTEKRIDDDYIHEFMSGTHNYECINYIEKVVNNGDETLAAIREDEKDYDLCIVGRGQGRFTSPLTAGLSDWSNCSELGPIGDTLVSSSFASRMSILVVHQYTSTSRSNTSNKRTDISI